MAAASPSPPPSLDAREKRVLNPRPLTHYRKTYSTTEVRAGAGVVAVLVAIAAWVWWRGAHPDPLLYGDPNAVLGKAGGAPAGPIDRGAVPKNLAGEGWREGTLSRFDATTLYQKIDGRADFFLARGFRSMTFVPLANAAAASVDLEFYDLGSAQNALGALTAEKPPDATATTAAGTSWYRARNALFVARGAYYARAIGSDESPNVLSQLERLRSALETGLAAGERPWAHGLFADALGVPADKVSFQAENAFSFAFARNVFSAALPDETEVFVMPAASAAEARKRAADFEKGFLDFGTKVDRAGTTWVKDRYLSAFSRATVAGTMVVGVRGAPKVEDAEAALAKVTKAVDALPPEVTAKAAKGDENPKGGRYE